MSDQLKLTLVVSGLSLEDAKQLAKALAEIAEKDSTRRIAVVVHGLEGKPPEEAKRILREIFPGGGVAG